MKEGVVFEVRVGSRVVRDERKDELTTDYLLNRCSTLTVRRASPFVSEEIGTDVSVYFREWDL